MIVKCSPHDWRAAFLRKTHVEHAQAGSLSHAMSGRRAADLKDLLVGLTRSLTAALDAKDAYTCGHSERVARIAVELARELGLDEEEIGNIYLAGLLHDIGEIGIDDAVLRMADRLTPEQFEHIATCCPACCITTSNSTGAATRMAWPASQSRCWLAYSPSPTPTMP